MRKMWALRRLVMFCVGALLSLLPTDSANAGPMTILTPKPTCTILAREPSSSLVLKITSKRDLESMKVEGQSGIIEPFGVWNKGNNIYPHFRLPLRPGKNDFEILPWDQTIKINYKPLRSVLNVRFDDPKIFMFHSMGANPKECAQCHTEAIPKEVHIPKVFYGPFDPKCVSCHKNMVLASEWQHGPTADWLCLYCHAPEKNPENITIFQGKPVDLCLTCHVTGRKWVKMPHVHGPVGTGDCTACHNPHGNKFRFQLWAEGQGPLCVACHVDKKKYLEASSSFFIHGIITGYGCVACHSPHATKYRFQLYKPINELCTGCHTSLKEITRGHPVGGHPLEGPKDPRRKGRKFSCTSCHNPHGSEYRFLLIGDILGGHVCSKCHY